MELAWNTTLVVCAIVFVGFNFVIIFGAPFLPTLNKRVPDAIKLISLKQGQTILELGSGDGRVLKAAAENGLKAIGYELNPLLVVYSKIRTIKYRKNVKIIWGNYWRRDWPEADGIFVFLLQPYMERLDKEITARHSKPIKLVSFAFTIPDKKPTKELDGMYLYVYK